MSAIRLPHFSSLLLLLLCAGCTLPPKTRPQVVIVEKEDGLSAMLTIDRQRLTWTLVVRNESDRPIGIFDRAKTDPDSTCAGASIRFRDRESRFIYNDPEMPVTTVGGWYSPASLSSRTVELPVQMQQLQPGQVFSRTCKVQDLLRGLTASRNSGPWLADHEFQIQITLHYDDAYLRKVIELRTDWIAPYVERKPASATTPS